MKSVAPTHTHDYDYIVIKEPTCTSEGVCAYKCSCGEIDISMSTVIDKLEHKYHQTATMPNTCIKKGTVTLTCTVFYYDADGSGENLYPYYVLVVNK